MQQNRLLCPGYKVVCKNARRREFVHINSMSTVKYRRDLAAAISFVFLLDICTQIFHLELVWITCNGLSMQCIICIAIYSYFRIFCLILTPSFLRPLFGSSRMIGILFLTCTKNGQTEKTESRPAVAAAAATFRIYIQSLMCENFPGRGHTIQFRQRFASSSTHGRTAGPQHTLLYSIQSTPTASTCGRRRMQMYDYAG